MAGRRKCQICKEWIQDDEESIKYKTGYAHRKCFNVAMKLVTTEKKTKLASAKKKEAPKPQKELKDGLSEEEYREKCKLCDYIRELTQEDLSVATYKLIEDYKKKYKISYTEMYQDLQWYFDLCGNAVEGDRVIAMVPLCHTEAQKYYLSIEKANVSCQENLKNLPTMYKSRRAVMSDIRRTPVDQIDISALGGDEDH